jgi:hypothetical protein
VGIWVGKLLGSRADRKAGEYFDKDSCSSLVAVVEIHDVTWKLVHNRVVEEI